MSKLVRSGETHRLGAYQQETRAESNGDRTAIVQKEGSAFWLTMLDRNGVAGDPVNLFPVGDPVQVANGGATSFDIAIRPDGRFLLAWTEVVLTTESPGGGTVQRSETQVVQRLYNSDGSAAGGRQIVAVTPDVIDPATGRLVAGYNEAAVSIERLADGRFVTGWQRADVVADSANPGFADPDRSDGGDIWFRISGPDGAPRGQASQLNGRDGGFYFAEDTPQLAALDNGGFSAVWRSDYLPDPGGPDHMFSLRLQVVSAAGARATEADALMLALNGAPAFSEREFHVRAIEGGFVLAVAGIKIDAADPAANQEVMRLYTFGNDGNLRHGAGDYFELARPAQSGGFDNGAFFGLDVAPINGGGYVATWAAPVASGAQSWRATLFAQAFDAEGAPLGPAARVLDPPGAWMDAGGRLIPHEEFVADAELVAQADGSLLVVANLGGAFDFAQMVLQRITPDGGLGPQAAPVAVRLDQTVAQLSEDAGTARRIRIAEITVDDDGAGRNAFTLVGPDAALFEVVGRAVYLRAGAQLDYETRSSYSVAVAVDDSSVAGRNPDALSQTITLNITDVAHEVLRGGPGPDVLRGGSRADTAYGFGGKDSLFGGAGDDRLYGGVGDDVLSGGAGRDSLYGGAGRDRIEGGAGADLLNGGSGGDSLSGGLGDDALFGGAGNDRLYGGAGRDSLGGGLGGDTLSGGAGNDRLTGGAGADVFEFGPGFGRDVITDFRNGLDRIRLIGGLTFDDVTATAVEGGLRLTFDEQPGLSLTLLQVRPWQIDAGDFL